MKKVQKNQEKILGYIKLKTRADVDHVLEPFPLKSKESLFKMSDSIIDEFNFLQSFQDHTKHLN